MVEGFQGYKVAVKFGITHRIHPLFVGLIGLSGLLKKNAARCQFNKVLIGRY